MTLHSVVLHSVPDKDAVMKCDTLDLPYAAA
jgi:hypothetical protein